MTDPSAGRTEREVLAVDHVHDVVRPAAHPGLHEVLVDVEIDRQKRVVGQHDAFGFLEQCAPPGRIGLADRVGEQSVVARVRVTREIDPEVALQQLGEGIGIVEVAEAQNLLAGAEYQDAAARVDVWRALLARAVAQGSLAAFADLLRTPGVQ